MTRRIKETPAYCVRCAKCGSVQCSLVPGDEFACGCGAWVKIPHAKKLPEGDSAWTGEAQRSRYFSSEWLAFTRARISCCSWRKKEWSAPKRSKSFTTISWPPLPQRTTIRARMSTISSSRLLSRCLPLLSPCFGESLASGGRAVKKADEFSRHRPERLREVIQILPVIRMNGYGAAHAASLETTRRRSTAAASSGRLEIPSSTRAAQYSPGMDERSAHRCGVEG